MSKLNAHEDGRDIDMTKEEIEVEGESDSEAEAKPEAKVEAKVEAKPEPVEELVMKKADSLIKAKKVMEKVNEDSSDDDLELEQILKEKKQEKKQKPVAAPELAKVDTIVINQERKKKKKKRSRSKSDAVTEGGPNKRRIVFKLENNTVRGKHFFSNITFRLEFHQHARVATRSLPADESTISLKSALKKKK